MNEKPPKKSNNILAASLFVIVVIVGIYFGVTYFQTALRSSNAASQSVILIDKTFSISVNNGNTPASMSWNFTVYYGNTIKIKVVTSGDILISGFVSYRVSANQGYGNPPDVRTFTVTQGGPTSITVLSNSLGLAGNPCEYQGNCPIINGQITVTKL